MSIEIKVPQLPESVADATLVTWHKQAGQSVSRDENLADLETDKVVLEVPAPVSGVLKELRIVAGTSVTSGQVLAVLEEGAPASAPVSPPVSAPTTAAAKPAAAAPAPAATTSGDKLAPSVRRMVEEKQLDPAKIPATGRDGRITKGDVVDYLDKPAAKPTAAPANKAAPAAPVAVGGAAGRQDQRVPMTRLRARIAERLLEAQQTQAQLTTFNEIDLKAVMDLRAKFKDGFEKKHGVKLGFMSFFVKAAVEALKRFPTVNASIEGNDIVYHEYYDIGVAVSTERGLMVPVLRDADLQSYADIEKNIGAYAARARDGKITIEELTGGTFSITNGGTFGSLQSTPIVNMPQSAILGMHKTMERPVVVNGEIVARPMMYVALSYDHRIIDGREAVQFLVTIKDCLEDPARLLLGV
ncbi:MAG TPA: 2-oxoglutarate dehydrogenase complex dihydrolipoyllysine-residue succinyltransferase [Steroidobacteraceae bacterium]|jgi:2-oxoglutarate dehydrogenase E2 component (dihydrolipoamide succinyltransferase)|nr:2-oxoglutarate dehydrogenase complex dihydrolipoyllysine-residue succinyltransferase [Steroidobacteraceae bacterium]